MRPGEAPTDVSLAAPNDLTIAIRGLPIPGTLVVVDGALRLTIAGPLGVELELLSPGATPLDLREVRVTDDRLVLEGDFDPAELG